MPEFQLDTSGKAYKSISKTSMEAVRWNDLDAFTQGYVMALFFTETDIGGTPETFDPANGSALPCDAGFADLAPDSLAKIIADCAAFQDGRAWADTLEGYGDAGEEAAGRDFWYTRNGHGAGFWDGDWPEPYATQLTDAAKAFGETDAYLGDDAKVHLS